MKGVSVWVFSIFLFFFVAEVSGQTAFDMVSLRNRRGRTVRTFFPGIPIIFGDKSGHVVQGTVKKVMKDSLFIQQFDIRRSATMWGTQVQDTIGTFLLKFHPNEIAWIQKPRRTFELIRNGTVFMVGGVGYSALHVFNAAYLKEPVLWPNVATAAAVSAAGLVMNRLRTRQYAIGKKYSLVYIDTTPGREGSTRK